MNNVRVILVNENARDAVRRALVAHGLWVTAVGGNDVSAFVVEPGSAVVDAAVLRAIPGVEAVLVRPSLHPRVDALKTTAAMAGITVGHSLVIAAGPCAAETEDDVHRLARAVRASGAQIFRGGAFKPRTSPYSFRGHGLDALKWLHEASRENGLRLCTEVLDPRDVEAVAAAADLVQVGARSMQNLPLLDEVGRCGRPVLLKRAPQASVEEWLLAAERLLVEGAPSVVFCERGGQGGSGGVRNPLDVSAIARLSTEFHLPVAVDPSHAGGRPDLLLPLALAGVGAGASMVLVEVHERPGDALSDGPQALPVDQLAAFIAALMRQTSRAA